LQQGIEASHRSLGEGWLDAWLCAPMWRFALPPGFCGPDGWAGVMMPSVDRAGRYFPLTLAACAPPGAPAGAMLAGDWIARLEAVALSALADDSDFDRFTDAVAGLPVFTVPRADGWAGGWRAQGTAGEPAALAQTLAFATTAALGAHCIFATHGGGRVSPATWVLPQLPAPRSFAGLIDDTASGGTPPAPAAGPAWTTSAPVAPLPVADTELGHAAGLFGSDFATEAPPSLVGEPPGGAFDQLLGGGEGPTASGSLPRNAFEPPRAVAPAASIPFDSMFDPVAGLPSPPGGAFDQVAMPAAVAAPPGGAFDHTTEMPPGPDGSTPPGGAFDHAAGMPAAAPSTSLPGAFNPTAASDDPFASLSSPAADAWVGEPNDSPTPPVDGNRLPPGVATEGLSPRALFGDTADDVPPAPLGLFDSKDGKEPR
jgi:type VI secretion system protein ImpM